MEKSGNCEPKELPSGLTDKQLLDLRSLVVKHHQMQKARVAFENRIRAINDGVTPYGKLGFIMETRIKDGRKAPHNPDPVSKKGQKKLLGIKNLERQLEKEMEQYVENHKLWIEWLQYVKGIGILTTAKLIAYFEPYWAELEIPIRKKKRHKGVELEEEETVTQQLYPPKHRSSLTRLCGLINDNDTGRAYKRERGKKHVGNPFYASIFYVLFEAVLRQKGECYKLWSKYHEETKNKYPEYLKRFYGAETREECKKLNKKTYIPNTLSLSRRRFIKTFISILWEKYQQIYGKDVGRPQHWNPELKHGQSCVH